MEQLLVVASQFPTVIYSVLLGIVIVYWIVGLLGFIDLDFSGDIELDIDSDVDVSVGGLTGLLLTFGLTGVPFTLVISIIILICWLISFYLQFYLLTWLPDGWLYYFIGTVSDFLIFVLSLPITAIAIRPLKGMFNSVETVTSRHLVGKEAIIATGSVNEIFGQARLFNEGAEILVDVRCDPQHVLKLGDKVLVVEYLEENHAYIVAPYVQ
ncbi:hypothetical protein tinsulaeT_05680 [Thalassotalea insulae]|uniref:DUF1449 domain-containing protein n=1 Tax=Thalassotalea insulae TaxID=2056778 RepID=A0ABQ6GMK2_9GAMM|nr:OB-fold-containig protein [Thalassotalea insulae]GLX77228.1 hypothetical protein tinsulaeT_05680 [Thalassotalea insulae]